MEATERASLTADVSATTERDVVTYHFPVQLEVVGELGHEELRRVARYVFDELDATLRDAH